MLGVGAAIKGWSARRKAKEQIRALDELIAQVERECSRPVLDGLSGADRFQSAVVLLDSTLLIQVGSAEDAGVRMQLLEQYLQKLHKEFEMARNDLKEMSASRAEVVALGLAVKEIALRLDQEIDGFHGQAAEALSQLRQNAQTTSKEMQARLTREITKVEKSLEEKRDQLGRHVDEKVSDGLEALNADVSRYFESARADHLKEIQLLAEGTRRDLKGDIQQQFRSVASKLNEQVKEAYTALMDEIRTRADSVRESLSSALDEKIRVSSEKLSEEVRKAQREQQLHLDRVRTELDSVAREQAESLSIVRTSLEQEIGGLSQRLAETQREHELRFERLQNDLESTARKQAVELVEIRTYLEQELKQMRLSHKQTIDGLTDSLHRLRVTMSIGFVLAMIAIIIF